MPAWKVWIEIRIIPKPYGPYHRPISYGPCDFCHIFAKTCLKIGLFNIYRSMNSLSPVLLSCGIDWSGIGLLRNLQSGSHPSFKFQTSRFSFGTVAITYSLCYYWLQNWSWLKRPGSFYEFFCHEHRLHTVYSILQTVWTI